MLVLLHGFAGTGRAWDLVAEHLGGTPYLAPTLGTDLPELPARCTLAGYSMGGRVALHLALAAPERVERLALVATTAGIEDATERATRRAADDALAARVESGTIEEFVDEWCAQPIFAGTPPDAARWWREDLLRNDTASVAAQLRRFGAGVLEPVWDRLGELTMPVDVVVGERDAKFLAIGERLAAALPDARLHVVPRAGHGIPREAPAALAGIITGHVDRAAPAADR